MDPIITRPPPTSCTYDLTSPTHTRITLPPASAWRSGLHWHETHTEYLLLVRGSIRLRVGSTTTILTAPANGEGTEVTVPIGARHEWGRATADGEEVVVVERTAPEDGAKSVFFWQLNGVVLGAGKEEERGWVQGLVGEWWIPLQLFVIFGVLDNWPVFLDLGSWGMVVRGVEWAVTRAVLAGAGVVGWVGGVEAVRKDRMPEGLWGPWEMQKGRIEREEE